MSTNIYDWIDNNKEKQLTIGDVADLKIGDKLDVCMFDRNFSEYGMWDKYTEFKGYDPEDILQYNRVTLHYKGDQVWDIEMDCGTFTHPFHLNTKDLDTNWTWYALNKDNKIHITTNVSNWKISECEPIIKHFNHFPDTTRIGWRGPMVLWEKVSDMPRIHWHILERKIKK